MTTHDLEREKDLQRNQAAHLAAETSSTTDEQK